MSFLRKALDYLDPATAQERRRSMLCDAIRRRRAVSVYYHGGRRTLEPYCIGLVRYGDRHNESLLGWQAGGYAEIGDAQGWKLYRAADMEDMEILRLEFDGRRPGFDPEDVDMARVLCYVRPASVEEMTAAAPVPVAAVKTPPAVTISEPSPPPAAAPEAVNLTHNDLMARFHSAHPYPVRARRVNIRRPPLPRPFP